MGPSPSTMPGVLMPCSTCLRAVDHRGDPIVEGDGRGARRTRQAFLQAGRGHVDLPGVHLERVAAERGRAVDVEQHVVPAAQRADLGQRLQHGGGGIAMTDGDHSRPMAA